LFSPETRILIVDDSKVQRRRLAMALEGFGLSRIAEAANGQEGLDKISEAIRMHMPYQLILSDWKMPVMEGIELLKFVKQIPQMRGVPFLMVTAESESDQLAEAIKLGVSGYLVKPISLDQLREQLEKVFARTAA